MALRTRCLYSFARTPVRHTQWQRIRITRRYYSSDSPDASVNPQSETKFEDAGWFEKLRDEMLNRELPLARDAIHDQTLKHLEATLYTYFPRSWKESVAGTRTPDRALPNGIGEHTIFCNPVLPEARLLPDGTDELHSPGGPFVRRMWAGGAVKVNKDLYYDPEAGWATHRRILCSERIKDVQLRGSGDKEKIFISIERNFARIDPLFDAIEGMEGRNRNFSLRKLLRERLRDWDQFCLTEHRNIVFFRERSAEQWEDIKAGRTATVKYLQTPNEPGFSYTITPTDTLLSRFSALTLNAHRIHLDREYARNVEGHRNLLIHGPLTLTLMLKFIGTYLQAIPEGVHMVEAIEYRNLAPLYCGEQLRLCAKEKEDMRMDDARIYDVWIEGPTGGMAVKGLVRTCLRPNRKQAAPPRATSKPSRRATAESTIGEVKGRNASRPVLVRMVEAKRLRDIYQPRIQRAPESTNSQHSHGTASDIHKVISDLQSDATHRSPSTTGIVKHNSSPPVIHRSEEPTNPEKDRPQQTIQLSSFSLPKPLIRLTNVPKPMRPEMSITQHALLQRTARRQRRPPSLKIEPLPLVRYYERNPLSEVEGSRFRSHGVVRKSQKLKIRAVEIVRRRRPKATRYSERRASFSRPRVSYVPYPREWWEKKPKEALTLMGVRRMQRMAVRAEQKAMESEKKRRQSLRTSLDPEGPLSRMR
ncbi:hypothetical protein BU23DRAFT_516994 [Bimuria novae-zelandiae CBS 107.79]|uniref:MaoC-like domain-containing protein n=1 Tax=Bimuria novae-zelandiae CBS 107.79 TaxID=1447943 RepID=A0A6A5UQW9_9PLEO|nr:hypothetical protein BU23DRAFT_516994 [Bimuria novae-zelandiae CBS 107.79]